MSQLVLNFGSLAVEDHPNKLTLKGVLTRLDEPSTKAPNGSEGHRILLPAKLAQKRLDTLIGMGLNYAQDLGGHAQRRKVGVITKAWINGKDLCIEGTVWKHDFPEAEKDLKQPGLGMSMEVGDVDVEDDKAPVWVLKDLCFLGGTILWQKSAAYHRTQAIAAAAKIKENEMAIKKKTTGTDPAERLVSIAAAAAAKAVGDLMTPLMARQIKMLAAIGTRIDNLEASNEEDEPSELEVLAADVEAACDKDSMKAAKKKKEDDSDDDEDDDEDDEEDDIDAEEINKGGLEDMGPKTTNDGEDDDTPGDLNKGATNRGRKTDTMDKVGKTVSSARLEKTLARALKVVKAQQETIVEMQASMQSMEATIRKNKKQLAAASSEMNRRSLDASTLGLLAKSGINAEELRASGTKLTVAEVDAVLDGTKLNLPPMKRIEAKNHLLRAGLMEEGAVNRGIGF